MACYFPVKIAYREYLPPYRGNLNLPPIIFLHDLTANKEHWLDIPQKVATRTKRKTYAFDARNHGESGYKYFSDFDTTVKDLFYFVDNTLRVPKVVLVGDKMGGETALRAALQQPKRVEMLFVQDVYRRKTTKEYFSMVAQHLISFVDGVENVPKHHPRSEVSSCIIDYMCNKSPPGSLTPQEKEHYSKSHLQLNKTHDGGFDVKFAKGIILMMIQNPPNFSKPSGVFDGPAYFSYGSKCKYFVCKEDNELMKNFPNAVYIKYDEAIDCIHVEYPSLIINMICKALEGKYTISYSTYKQARSSFA